MPSEKTATIGALLTKQEALEETLADLAEEMMQPTSNIGAITKQLGATTKELSQILRQIKELEKTEEIMPLKTLQTQIEALEARLSLKKNNIVIINNTTEEAIHIHLGEKTESDIKEVFDVLLCNAADAMVNSPRKFLTISSQLTETNIIIKIEDTGPGIPEAVQEKIFKSQVTTKQKNDQNFGGQGIGLYFAFRTIEELGGTLTYETSNTHGTTFTIILPKAT